MTEKTTFELAPVIPVITLTEVGHAVPLARALLTAGLRVLEITIRTPAALPAIEAIARELPEVIVGAGTLLTPDQFTQARNAGARFCVSPGLTPALAEAADDCGLPYLPGVSTTTEIMLAREMGFDTLKFFPAALNGGPAFLKAIYPLFPDVSFCPTGGVGLENLKEFLDLPNVICVGTSSIATQELIEKADWKAIAERAQHIQHAIENL